MSIVQNFLFKGTGGKVYVVAAETEREAKGVVYDEGIAGTLPDFIGTADEIAEEHEMIEV